jgi:enterochelin esterase family protein
VRDGNGVWRQTWEAPANLRTVYWFAHDDALDDWEQWHRDPLNPRTYVYPADPEVPDDRELVGSLLELPAAAPYGWSERRDGVREGTTQMHRLASPLLRNERRVFVYIPPGYDPRRAHPLLVVFDGFAYTTLVPLPTVLDNLIAAGRIPPLVAVMPDSLDSETRMRELCFHEPFVDFVVDELLPWARERWNVTDRPADTVLAGSSLGGLTSAFAAVRRPDAIGNVLSMSGSFGREPPEEEPPWLPRHIAGRERLPLRWYLDAGILETIMPPGDVVRPSLLHANRHLRDVLRAKGYEVHYQEFPGGHEYLWWRETIADGLVALLGETR